MRLKFERILNICLGVVLLGCGHSGAIRCTDNFTGAKVECKLEPGPEVRIDVALTECFVGYDRNITIRVPDSVVPASSIKSLSKSCGCLATEIESEKGSTLLHFFYSPKGGQGPDVQEILALDTHSKTLATISVSATSTPEVTFSPPSVHVTVERSKKASFKLSVNIKPNRKSSVISTIESFPLGVVGDGIGGEQGVAAVKLRLEPNGSGVVKGNVRFRTVTGRQLLYPVRIVLAGEMRATPSSVIIDAPTGRFTTTVSFPSEIRLNQLRADAWSEQPPRRGDEPGSHAVPDIKMVCLDKKHVMLYLSSSKDMRGLKAGSVFITNSKTGERLAIPYDLFIPSKTIKGSGL